MAINGLTVKKLKLYLLYLPWENIMDAASLVFTRIINKYFQTFVTYPEASVDQIIIITIGNSICQNHIMLV